MTIEGLISKYKTHLEDAIKVRDDPKISKDLYYNQGAQIVVYMQVISDLQGSLQSSYAPGFWNRLGPELLKVAKSINDHWNAGNFSRESELWNPLREIIAETDAFVAAEKNWDRLEPKEKPDPIAVKNEEASADWNRIGRMLYAAIVTAASEQGEDSSGTE